HGNAFTRLALVHSEGTTKRHANTEGLEEATGGERADDAFGRVANLRRHRHLTFAHHGLEQGGTLSEPLELLPLERAVMVDVDALQTVRAYARRRAEEY